jgi:hypothetical protein
LGERFIPRVTWPLQGNRPIVEIQVVDAASGHMVTGSLLADTGGADTGAGGVLMPRLS